MALPAPELHTMTGALEMGAPPKKVSKSEKFNDLPSKTLKFSRLYQHYIDNVAASGSAASRANFWPAGTMANLGATESNYGLHPIPYNNLGVSTTSSQFNMINTLGNCIRVKSLGYKVHKQNILQEKLIYQAGSAVVENIYDSNPSIMYFKDSSRMWQEYVGYSEKADSITGRVRCGDTMQQFLPSFTHTNNVDKDNNSADCWFDSSFPQSQVNGKLEYASFYTPQENSRSFNTLPGIPNAGVELTAIMDMEITKSGDTKEHTWVNPNPVWHLCGFQKARPNRDAALPGYWPQTRKGALLASYPGPLLAFKGDLGSGLADAINLNTDGLEACPDMHFVKVQPQWGPEGYMNLTAEIWIEYTMEIEVKWAGYTDNTVTFNAIYQNNDASNISRFTPAGLMNRFTRGLFNASAPPTELEEAREFHLF